MSQLVELSSLDLRYEGYRLRDDAREARVLVSVAERGIEDPLEGVDTPAARLLLNGFKRLRSAKKLGIDSVPYVSLGAEEALGILSLMRASTDKALNLLELPHANSSCTAVAGPRQAFSNSISLMGRKAAQSK